MERIAVAAEMMAMEAQKFNSCLATFAMQSARQGKRVIKLLDQVLERTTTLTKMGSLTGLPKSEETVWCRLSPTDSYAPRNYDFHSTNDLLVVASHWPLAFHVTGLVPADFHVGSTFIASTLTRMETRNPGCFSDPTTRTGYKKLLIDIGKITMA